MSEQTPLFKLPTRITTVDYVGVSTAFADSFRDRAMSELEVLYNHMKFKGLKQYQRNISTADNVQIKCNIIFGTAQAVIVIGGESDIAIDEYACFCCAYEILAGRIMEVTDEDYATDAAYRADIKVCQKTGTGTPKLIKTSEIRKSAGVVNETIKSLKDVEFYISDTFLNVPFTDRYRHETGSLVLVLAMPLVDFRPGAAEVHHYGGTYTEKAGSWSPEVNRRRVVNRSFEDPVGTLNTDAPITSLYQESTGHTNALTLDAPLWDEENGGDLKYCPFRILPIILDSCFTGYKHGN